MTKYLVKITLSRDPDDHDGTLLRLEFLVMANSIAELEEAFSQDDSAWPWWVADQCEEVTANTGWTFYETIDVELALP